jgi:EAL domain-containing protein (putative c-di-GMP-specific phosphodiesterase class I)
VLESLLALAKRLGACTILEGIETRADLAVAERLGVDAVQGYLFRPHFVTAHAS